ncbi:MAG: DUF1700 domain-containing protein [Oscillospiraceae bacterium]|nr:DUF1700 domain-containing protein [Oscillospiraceae bacterium]MBR4692360.1 DUF1700 domain-containing protein [Oscillospiraceae bacterium]
MNKEAFLLRLREAMAGFPEDAAESSLEYYGEMIDDKMEDGLSEEEAVAALGSVEEITAEILRELPLPRLIRARVKPKRRLRGWELTLLILGFPLWFPLLLAAASVVLAVYIVLWAVVISLFAVDLSLAAAGLAAVIYGALQFVLLKLSQGAFCAGAGLVLIGLAILFFFVCRASAAGAVAAGRNLLLGIKSIFVRKADKNESID